MEILISLTRLEELWIRQATKCDAHAKASIIETKKIHLRCKTKRPSLKLRKIGTTKIGSFSLGQVMGWIWTALTPWTRTNSKW